MRATFAAWPLILGSVLYGLGCQPRPPAPQMGHQMGRPENVPATVPPAPPVPAVEPALETQVDLDVASLLPKVDDLHPTTDGLPVVLPPPPDPQARRQWLEDNLDALFGKVGQPSSVLANARIGVAVAELDTGRTLYQRQARAQLNAASNVKLITMAAAMAVLGPEYQFRTTVLGPARTTGLYLKPGGELDGDIYLRAGGDPTLSPADLGRLVDQLRALGIRRITGSLVVDRSFFDAQSMPPGYDQKDESGAFRAPSSAASLAANAVAVTVVPAAQPGGAARVTLSPASAYLQLQGRVTTAARGPAWPQVQTRDGGTHTVVEISGRVAIDADPVTVMRRIVHPELFLGVTFLELLQARGIRVDKPLRVDAAPEGLRTLAVHASEPLAVIVHDLGKLSNNFTAEQVVRTLGAETLGPPGSWEKGLEAIARYLDKLGIPRDEYRLENAAGLYDSNRFSAEQMVRVLRAALMDFRIAGEFLAALSLAGSDGTLAHRMAGSPAERYLRGKTGTLSGTSCLTGVVGAPGQQPLLFSILMNQVSDTVRARAVQDQAGAILAWYLDPRRSSGTDAAPPVAAGKSSEPVPAAP